jgi:hypothetical protein
MKIGAMWLFAKELTCFGTYLYRIFKLKIDVNCHPCGSNHKNSILEVVVWNGWQSKTTKCTSRYVVCYHIENTKKQKIYLEIFCLGSKVVRERLAQVCLHSVCAVNNYLSTLQSFTNNWLIQGFGNFEEIGPLDSHLNPRPFTWINTSVQLTAIATHSYLFWAGFQNIMTLFFSASIVFVDNPVGTGFSYVDDLKLLTVNENQIATDLLTFFKAFLQRYPIFQTLPFYIFSESYGGKVITIRLVKSNNCMISNNWNKHQRKSIQASALELNRFQVFFENIQSINPNSICQRIDWKCNWIFAMLWKLQKILPIIWYLAVLLTCEVNLMKVLSFEDGIVFCSSTSSSNSSRSNQMQFCRCKYQRRIITNWTRQTQRDMSKLQSRIFRMFKIDGLGCFGWFVDQTNRISQTVGALSLHNVWNWPSGTSVGNK